MIDLHTHSTASDGTLSPRDLVRLAAKSKLDAVALTDHDTLDGLEEALAAGREFDIEVIPGCELSVDLNRGSMHIVGLWTKPDSPALCGNFSFIHTARAKRNQKIINKLNEMSIDITLKEVEALAQGTIGRPHIAQVLVKKGLVRNFEEAFHKYVGNNGKAYVPRARLSVQQALAALSQDGATSILAHPRFLGLRPPQLEEKLRELKGLGLDGMEVYYPGHDARTMDHYLRIADRLGLAISGGSDFHGAVKPNITLGRGKGSLFIPARVLDDLKTYRKEKGLWT